MSANKLPAADAAAFCAKQMEDCRETRLRQVAPGGMKENGPGLVISDPTDFSFPRHTIPAIV
jgi:hypothetical protein